MKSKNKDKDDTLGLLIIILALFVAAYAFIKGWEKGKKLFYKYNYKSLLIPLPLILVFGYSFFFRYPVWEVHYDFTVYHWDMVYDIDFLSFGLIFYKYSYLLFYLGYFFTLFYFLPMLLRIVWDIFYSLIVKIKSKAISNRLQFGR